MPSWAPRAEDSFNILSANLLALPAQRQPLVYCKTHRIPARPWGKSRTPPPGGRLRPGSPPAASLVVTRVEPQSD